MSEEEQHGVADFAIVALATTAEKIFNDKMSFAEMELRDTLEKTRSIQMTCPVKCVCYLIGMAFNIFRRTKFIGKSIINKTGIPKPGKKRINRAQLIRKAALNASAGWQKIDMNHEIEIVTDKKMAKIACQGPFCPF